MFRRLKRYLSTEELLVKIDTSFDKSAKLLAEIKKALL